MAASAWEGAKCEATTKGSPSVPATRAPLTDEPRIQAVGAVPSPGMARTCRSEAAVGASTAPYPPTPSPDGGRSDPGTVPSTSSGMAPR